MTPVSLGENLRGRDRWLESPAPSKFTSRISLASVFPSVAWGEYSHLLMYSPTEDFMGEEVS